MILRRLIAILTLLFIATSPALAQKLPKTIVHSPEVLYKTKKRVLVRDQLIMPAYRQLIEEANKALKRPTQTVVHKPAPPPRGKMHDYWSISPYWWPNPDTYNGLPFIQRDGERNPEAASSKYDRTRLHETASDALTLALAWYFSGNEQYAGKGAALIFSWCCDSVTRMTPHMEYAQMRPGKKPGTWESSPYGLIDGRELIKMVEAARILEPSHAWGRAITNKLTKWVEAYVKWMQYSKLGAEASGLSDNHGTWYDAQLAVFSLFLDQKDVARSIVGTITPRRMVSQIERNGSLPYELKRPRSRHHTFFTLEAYFTLAAVGERVDVDVWNLSDGEVSIKKAFDYAAPYLATDEPWPFGSVGKYDPFLFTPLFHRAAMVYKEDRYRDILKALPEDKLLRDRAQLFY